MLKDRGYGATALSFYGSQNVVDFTDITEQECVDAVSVTVNALAREGTEVYGIGVSLGGALLLEHAKRHDTLSGIVSIGTPFRLRHRWAIDLGFRLLPVAYPLWRRLQRRKHLRLSPIGAAKAMIGYMEGTFLRDLESITTPTLFLHSRKDQVTDHQALAEYVPKISSVRKKVVFFKNGNHVIDYNPLTVEWALEFFGLIERQEHPVPAILEGQAEGDLVFERIQ